MHVSFSTFIYLFVYMRVHTHVPCIYVEAREKLLEDSSFWHVRSWD